jgi:hypothetical protein
MNPEFIKDIITNLKARLDLVDNIQNDDNDKEFIFLYENIKYKFKKIEQMNSVDIHDNWLMFSAVELDTGKLVKMEFSINM